MTTYTFSMEDLALLIGTRFREIRKQIATTQDAFSARSGLSQAQISYIENGNSFKSIQKAAAAIERAGGDPLDLLRHEPPLDPLVVQIRDLAAAGTDADRKAILAILERIVSVRKDVSAAE